MGNNIETARHTRRMFLKSGVLNMFFKIDLFKAVIAGSFHRLSDKHNNQNFVFDYPSKPTQVRIFRKNAKL